LVHAVIMMAIKLPQPYKFIFLCWTGLFSSAGFIYASIFVFTFVIIYVSQLYQRLHLRHNLYLHRRH
jgi:hypothetical protein